LCNEFVAKYRNAPRYRGAEPTGLESQNAACDFPDGKI
jgi:hypothetical protein